MEEQRSPNNIQNHDPLAHWLLIAMLICATFLQKIAIPIGSIQIFLGLPLILGIMAFGFITRRLELKSTNLFLYLAMVGVLILTQILGGFAFSIGSILLIMIIHAPYAFGLKSNSTMAGVQFLYFQRIMVIIAIIGIAQYFLQFIVGVNIAYFLDLMPMQNIIMQGFNGTIPLNYGNTTLKSNGFFMQEPSNFSQLLAVAIMVDIIYFKNLKRIILFTSAIAVTFSGTGLLILFALVPIYLAQHRKFITLGILLLGVITAPIWSPVIGVDKTVNRANEFTSTESSAYARFLSIIPSLNEHIVPQTQTFLFGLGAGSILRVLGSSDIEYEWHNPSWGKMIFEYGVIGGFAYFIFIGLVFWRGSGSPYIKFALLIQLMILGEYILPPTLHSLILALLIWSNPFTNNKNFYNKGRAFFMNIKQDTNH